MNLPGDVAVPHPAPRYDGNRIRAMVDAFEVSAQLDTRRGWSARPSLMGLEEVMDRTLALELNQLAQPGFPTLGVP